MGGAFVGVLASLAHSFLVVLGVARRWRREANREVGVRLNEATELKGRVVGFMGRGSALWGDEATMLNDLEELVRVHRALLVSLGVLGLRVGGSEGVRRFAPLGIPFFAGGGWDVPENWEKFHGVLPNDKRIVAFSRDVGCVVAIRGW
jgi:hypothetical protein